MPTRELILAPNYPNGDVRPVTRVRSTLLSASLQSVRDMGWEKRYFAALPAARHDEMRTLIAGMWMPLELAVAHYTACDGMDLRSDEVMEVGKAVSLRTQKTFVGTLGSIAAGAGATPWHLYKNGHRIWGRIFDGGDNIAYRLGPKDIEIIALGCPLLLIRYFRVSFCAYYAALAGLVAKSVHWRELPERRGEPSIAMRVSWV
jgi:hypothetical protein